MTFLKNLQDKISSFLVWILSLGVFLGFFYLALSFYIQGDVIFALVAMALGSIFALVFFYKKLYAWRYVFPALFAMIVFVLLPLIYTVTMAFTNYSGQNILSLNTAQSYILKEKFKKGLYDYRYQVWQDQDKYLLSLESKKDPQDKLVSQIFSKESVDINLLPATPLPRSFQSLRTPAFK